MKKLALACIEKDTWLNILIYLKIFKSTFIGQPLDVGPLDVGFVFLELFLFIYYYLLFI